MRNNKSIPIEGAIYIFIFSIFFLFSFKLIRNLMPPPMIGKDKIVGYAQYFGYPIYFDAVVFLLFLSMPALAALVILTRQKFVRFKKNDSKKP